MHDIHWEIGQVEETLHSMFFTNPGKLRMAEEVKRDQMMRWCSQTTEGILGRDYESFDQILS